MGGREAQIAMSPTQAGRFLALGETIVRTHQLSSFHPTNSTPAVAVLSLRAVGYDLLSFS